MNSKGSLSTCSRHLMLQKSMLGNRPVFLCQHHISEKNCIGMDLQMKIYHERETLGTKKMSALHPHDPKDLTLRYGISTKTL